MSAQAIRLSECGLPAGLRRPLAIVAALFCVASGLPLFSQVDIALAWPAMPSLVAHVAPRRATRAALADRAAPMLEPVRLRFPLVAVMPSSIVARPAFGAKMHAAPSVARRLPDDIGPPGTFARYAEEEAPPRPRAAMLDPLAPVAAVVPTPAAGPVPTAPPVRRAAIAYLSLASASTHNYNEFSSGQWRPESFMVEGAYALPHPALALKLDYREDVYVTNDSLVAPSGVHQTQFTTVSGAVAQTPVFYARQSTFDARVEAQVLKPHIYLGAGYIHTTNNYHFASLGGIGFGVEKLPDFHTPISVYGSVFYYPVVTGTSNVTNPGIGNVGGTSYQQSYAITKYDLGGIIKPVHVPVYLYGGFSGDVYHTKEAAPVNQSHSGAYAGLGVKL